MAETGVEFHGVWKKFHRGELNDSLRDLIPELAARAFGRGPRRDELSAGDFWALRDVSFRVGPGEVFGIIGANGAGKSTVLKIVSKILRPNRGGYVVRGRIGGLIEVAAGFHPDLTGRENVFLQGAILGMRTSAIREKFDEIVAFSGIEDFIDTPVKRYSTGMNARLGFSIAAHLDPDVLIIDEVLAVGDFAFQEKAFGRLRSLARSGLPVIVVSHQLDRIAELCTSAILLERGEIVYQGSPKDCIEAYVGGGRATARSSHDCPVRFDSVELLTARPLRSGEYASFRIEGCVSGPVPDRLEPVSVRIRELTTGHLVFATSNSRLDLRLPKAGPFTVDLELQLNVPVGDYVVETVAWDRQHHLDSGTGPFLRIEVNEGRSFWGSVQMNPEMRLSASGVAADGVRALRA